ncbi:MAG: hypothetical protein AAF384_07595 [Pseudomonadota bacterium]
MSGALPDGFGDLETWVDEWSLATQNARWDKRLASSKEEITAFYEAVSPRVEAILDHADGFALGALPEDSERLYDLALMVAEIAPNVELYQGDPNVPYSFEERRFIAVHGESEH